MGDIADIVGGGTPSTKNLDYWGGDIDWYSPIEIGDQIYINGSRKKITKLGLKNSSAKILPINTVLFTPRAGIGKTAILAKEGATNQGFQSIIPKENLLDAYFIFSKTHALKKYGEINGAGSTFVEVSGKQMAKMPILLPVVSEQTKISKFLKYLNNYIVLHQRKINTLESLKKLYFSMTFPKKDNNIPLLRFKNFKDAWEQRKFERLVERVSSASEKSGLPRIEYEDIISNQGRLNKNVYLKNSRKKGIKFKTHDILFGKLRPYLNKWLISEFDGIAVGDFWVLRSYKIENKFIYYLIQTAKFKSVSNISTGTRMPRSDWNVVSNSQFYTPKNNNEAIAISKIITSLDNLLTLHQRKINILESIKQQYLSLIFPENNKNTPVLGFMTFKEAWKQYKLGELSEIVRGASPRPIKDKNWFDQNSDIGWLRISDVTEQNGKIHYLSQKLSKEGQSKTRVLNSQHLLLSIAASVGKPVINYVKTGVHDGFLIFLNPKFNINFGFEWLEYFRPRWQRYGQPGSQVNLNSDIVRTQSIQVPSIEEQNKISGFLMSLNNYINLHHEKMTILENLKRSYLHKMFL